MNWTIVSGALPDGLTLNPNNGQISGTPTSEGTFDFTVQVTDSSSPGTCASRPLSITVLSAQQGNGGTNNVGSGSGASDGGTSSGGSSDAGSAGSSGSSGCFINSIQR